MDLLSRDRVIIKNVVEDQEEKEIEQDEIEQDEIEQDEIEHEEQQDDDQEEMEEESPEPKLPDIKVQNITIVNTCRVEDSPETFDYQKMAKDRRFYYFLFVVFLVAAAGSYLIYESMKTEFYDTLEKPVWAPPSSTISLIWIILYFIISFATYMSYLYGTSTERKTLLWIFGIQLALNFLWSYTFFHLKNPRAARIIILLLLCMIIIQGSYMHSLDQTSGYFFIPYFLWVCFAAYLNFEIVRLNQL